MHDTRFRSGFMLQKAFVENFSIEKSISRVMISSSYQALSVKGKTRTEKSNKTGGKFLTKHSTTSKKGLCIIHEPSKPFFLSSLFWGDWIFDRHDFSHIAQFYYSRLHLTWENVENYENSSVALRRIFCFSFITFVDVLKLLKKMLKPENFNVLNFSRIFKVLS